MGCYLEIFLLCLVKRLNSCKDKSPNTHTHFLFLLSFFFSCKLLEANKVQKRLRLTSCSLPIQTKKKFYDTELENLERQQKQQIEKMEQDHSLCRREEAKRIRLEQERDHVKFLEQLKQMKKEVKMGTGCRQPSFLQLFLPGKLQHCSIAELQREALVGVLAGSSCFSVVFLGVS